MTQAYLIHLFFLIESFLIKQHANTAIEMLNHIMHNMLNHILTHIKKNLLHVLLKNTFQVLFWYKGFYSRVSLVSPITCIMNFMNFFIYGFLTMFAERILCSYQRSIMCWVSAGLR